MLQQHVDSQPGRGAAQGEQSVCAQLPQPRSQSLAHFHSGNRKETRKSTILDFLNSVSKSMRVSNKARQEFLYVILKGHKTRSQNQCQKGLVKTRSKEHSRQKLNLKTVATLRDVSTDTQITVTTQRNQLLTKRPSKTAQC